MSRTLTQFQIEEYARFREHLAETWALEDAAVRPLEEKLKPLYKRYLSLACAATVSGHRTARGEYAEGVVEGSRLSLILSLKGLENPTCVLLRQSVELVLKHVYFSTHPVEHGWASSREDYKDLTFQTLLEYLCRTDQHRRLSNGNVLVERLNFWYGKLSRHVHVHNKAFLRYRCLGGRYEPKAEDLVKLEERTKELWPIFITILVVQFPTKYEQSSALEKRLIRSGLTSEYRVPLDTYLRSITR